MKDAAYVVCAAVSILLVGAGIAEIPGSNVARPRSGGFPEIRHMMGPNSPFASEDRSSTAGMVPVAAVFYLLLAGAAGIGELRLFAEAGGGRVFRPVGLAFADWLRFSRPAEPGSARAGQPAFVTHLRGIYFSR